MEGIERAMRRRRDRRRRPSGEELGQGDPTKPEASRGQEPAPAHRRSGGEGFGGRVRGIDHGMIPHRFTTVPS